MDRIQNLCQSVYVPDESSGAQRLAHEVKERRKQQDWTQKDVVERRGPSTETLRLIEKAARDSYGDRTLRQLDRALSWSDGTAKKILDGTATARDISTLSMRSNGGRDFIWTRFRNVADTPRNMIRPGEDDATVAPGEEVEVEAVVQGEDDDGYRVKFLADGSLRPWMKDEWLLIGTSYGQSSAVNMRPSVEDANAQNFAKWGPIPLRNAASNVGVTLGLLANTENPDAPRVLEARRLMRQAMNLLFDELDANPEDRR